jgi:hypothetical protein
MPTLNALRKYLADHGCVEERVLRVPERGTIFIQWLCRMKKGTMCRAVLAMDGAGGEVPPGAMTELGRRLAPCLGRGWITSIPEEDPFG